MLLNFIIKKKPGKSRRVYAAMGNTAPVPSNNIPQTPQSNVAPQSNPQQENQPYSNLPPLQPIAANPPPHFTPEQIAQLPEMSWAPLGLPRRPNAKPRIDPNQIPSPVQIQLKDEATYSQPDYYYGTCNMSETLPLASTNFKTLDQGNCNPRFMRSTLQSIPQTHDLVNDTSLPFGLILQPFALTHREDAAIPVVPLKGGSITRCNRCKAYINPWCRYTQGGKKYSCNLCQFENPVPEDEFCPCDMNGRRMDVEMHPELIYGSVEFEVPEEYWMDVQPKPLHWLCMLDVSRQSVQSGMLKTFCDALKNMVQNGLHSGLKIGIVTFDTTLHFYNLKVRKQQV